MTHCGVSLSNTECIICALILPHSPSDIYISECIEISVVQPLLEWLMSRNLFYRNITLDNRFVVACK